MARVNPSICCLIMGLVFVLFPQALASSPPTEGSALVGTVWVLESLNRRPALGTVPVTLDLSDTQFGGHSGCNWYGGAYRATATTFAIASYQTTLRGCRPAALRQEAAYAVALSKAARYRVAGDEMELSSKGGTLLVFRKEPRLTSVQP